MEFGEKEAGGKNFVDIRDSELNLSLDSEMDDAPSAVSGFPVG